MIAANQVGTELGFECAENALVLLWLDGREELGQADKGVLARMLIERIAIRYRASQALSGVA